MRFRLGSSALLQTAGANVSRFNTSVIVEGDLAITLDTTPADQHLGYKAIQISNLTTVPATMTTIVNTFWG